MEGGVATSGDRVLRLTGGLLSKAALLAVVADARTETGGLAALRAASRLADGVAKMSSVARARGIIAEALPDIQRKGKEPTERKENGNE